MKIGVNKIVMVTGTDSVFTDFLGRFGIVTEYAYSDKWMVKFQEGLRGRGSLSYTVLASELKVIGEITP
jgi:hypothetical protein